MIALLDACVLYAANLRNLLMWAAASRLYQARWTDAIHEEWIGNLLNNRPGLDPAKLQRTRQLMDAIHPECLVTGYERHIPTLQLPDENDRHVLAAAIEARADVVVTFNLSDFPKKALEPLNIRAIHPDQFLVQIYRSKSEAFLDTVRTHRTSLQKPAQDVSQYLDTLKICGLPDLVSLLEAHREEC